MPIHLYFPPFVLCNRLHICFSVHLLYGEKEKKVQFFEKNFSIFFWQNNLLVSLMCKSHKKNAKRIYFMHCAWMLWGCARIETFARIIEQGKISSNSLEKRGLFLFCSFLR